MAITVTWFGQGAVNLMKGNIDMDSDAFKASLHTSSYSPNIDTHDFFDDCTNELSTAAGYTAGGKALSGMAVSYDAASDQARWDLDDISWTVTGAGFTFRHCVIRKSRGGAASADELLCWIDMGADVAVSAGTYTLQIDAAGLLNIDVT